jgi:hypothetical protein
MFQRAWQRRENAIDVFMEVYGEIGTSIVHFVTGAMATADYTCEP